MPHHLIDLVEPSASYSAGQFVRDAAQAIEDIESRGRVPLLVGGTMLYLRALTGGIAELPEGDARLRADSMPRPRASGGLRCMRAWSESTRPPRRASTRTMRSASSARWKCTRWEGDRSRSCRRRRTPALEREFSGRALIPQDRARLHAALEQRFAQMMAAGLLDEVRGLYARGDLTDAHPAIRAVGYRQLWAHLDGSYSLDTGGDARSRGHSSIGQTADDLAALDAKHPGLRSL